MLYRLLTDNKATGAYTYYHEDGRYYYISDTKLSLTDTSTSTCVYSYVHPTMPEIVIDFKKTGEAKDFNFVVGSKSGNVSKTLGDHIMWSCLFSAHLNACY